MGTPSKPRPVATGCYNDKIPFVRIGEGPKSVVIFPSSNELLRNPLANPAFPRDTYTRFFSEEYTIHLLGYDPNFSPGCSPNQIATEFREIIANQIGATTIMAISYGGFVAIPFAARFPDLVKRLILVSTGHQLESKGQAILERWVTLAKQNKQLELMLAVMELYQSPSQVRQMQAYIRGHWEDTQQQLNPVSVLINAYSFDIAVQMQELMQSLSQISAPTLIIGGNQDPLFSVETFSEMGKLIPNATVKIMENEGHLLFLEKHSAVRSLIANFLSQNGS
jgi:pimeloyl-ACP methyl ester carboxylesterase